MAKEIQTFLLADRTQDRADSSPQPGNCPLCGLAQQCLELAEDLFDRVEIRRIRRQINCHAARGLDRFRHAGDLVGWKVVHDDDVTTVERRGQTSFDIGEKYPSVHRPINHEGSYDCVMAQAGYQRDRLPMPMRNGADQPFTTGATAPQPHHLGAGGGFVDEYQPGRVKHELFSPPASARAGYVRPLLLRGVKGFFLKVKSCRAKNRQTAVRLPGIRRLRIVATISSSVKSGCWATRASSAFACFSNGDLLPPVGFALALPVSRHRCNHFTAELGHRLKLSAASRRDAPASTASITRSRKSSEYGFGIAWTPKGRISAVRLVPRHALGNPFDSTQPGNALAPIVAALWAAGVTSWYGIAKALNARGVPTATGRGV